MRRGRGRGMRGGPGRMPPYMRGPPGQKFVVSHSTFDPVLVSCLQDFLYKVNLWTKKVRFPYNSKHLLSVNVSSLFLLNYFWEKVRNCCMYNKRMGIIRKSYRFVICW